MYLIKMNSLSIFIACFLKGSQEQSFFPSDTLIYGISRDGSKNFNIRTCEHMILGQLRMGARQTKNAPLIACYKSFSAVFFATFSGFFQFLCIALEGAQTDRGGLLALRAKDIFWHFSLQFFPDFFNFCV